MKKEIRIYNIILPIYLLWLIPIVWVIALPANFVIDLAVIVLSMKKIKVIDIRMNAKSSIIKVWFFGFMSDFIGAGCMLLFQVFNTYETIFSFMVTVIAVLISALCIKVLDNGIIKQLKTQGPTYKQTPPLETMGGVFAYMGKLRWTRYGQGRIVLSMALPRALLDILSRG